MELEMFCAFENPPFQVQMPTAWAKRKVLDCPILFGLTNFTALYLPPTING